MTADLAISVFGVVALAIAVAYARFPRWYGLAIQRGLLREVRDDIADAILDGRLPLDHPAVKHLYERAEVMLDHIREMTPFHGAAVYFSIRGLSPAARAAFDEECRDPSLEGLSDDQCALVNSLSMRLLVTVAGAFIRSSWLGTFSILGLVLWSRLATILRWFKSRSPRVAAMAASEATVELLENTRLGHVARSTAQAELVGLPG